MPHQTAGDVDWPNSVEWVARGRLQVARQAKSGPQMGLGSETLSYGWLSLVDMATEAVRTLEPATRLDPSLVEGVVARAQGPSLALCLYGSRAMGNHQAQSDIDVLQLVTGRSGSYSVGSFSFSAYLPQTLLTRISTQQVRRKVQTSS